MPILVPLKTSQLYAVLDLDPVNSVCQTTNLLVITVFGDNITFVTDGKHLVSEFLLAFGRHILTVEDSSGPLHVRADRLFSIALQNDNIIFSFQDKSKMIWSVEANEDPQEVHTILVEQWRTLVGQEDG